MLLPDHPSEHTVRDVKQARMLLEVEMVGIAARSCTPADAERLKEALEANRKAISDSTAFLETDMAMHSMIARISGNSLFVAMSRDMLGWLARFQTDAVHVEGSVMLSYREHVRIIELIVAHDPDGAAKAMYEHLSRSHLAYGRLSSQQALLVDSREPTRAKS
jgi:DNA-binding FadR family transcriptional regulator